MPPLILMYELRVSFRSKSILLTLNYFDGGAHLTPMQIAREISLLS